MSEIEEKTPEVATEAATGLSRRKFVVGAAAVGIAAIPIVAAGCATAEKESSTTKAPAGAPAEKSTTTTAMTADSMDDLAGAKVKAFPAKTKGLGGQPLKPKIENGVKVFELTVAETDWEVEPGRTVKAMTYNGVTPGPEIRITEGDKVKINVKNNLKESTSVHWHGVRLPNKQDGVPFLTQDPIKPGETYTYEFTAKNFGSHMYHSHHNAAAQVGGGLLGPFIIEPKDKSKEPKADVDHTIILNDGAMGFTLNGKSFPATRPITAKVGQTVRIRYMNEGFQIHPMHLHGYTFRVIARDGVPLGSAEFSCDTLTVAPGERWDTIVDVDTPGAWALHCHILTHAEAPEGMFGMVTALIVEE